MFCHGSHIYLYPFDVRLLVPDSENPRAYNVVVKFKEKFAYNIEKDIQNGLYPKSCGSILCLLFWGNVDGLISCRADGCSCTLARLSLDVQL
jgi:hypothetical protein